MREAGAAVQAQQRRAALATDRYQTRPPGTLDVALVVRHEVSPLATGGPTGASSSSVNTRFISGSRDGCRI